MSETEGQNESVDVPADDPQPTGPADPGEVRDFEQEEPLRQEPAPGDDDVPDGTINEVLEWVSDDPERARRALQVERSGQNRVTLVSQLEDKA